MGVRLTVKMKSSSEQPKTVVFDEDVITFGRDQTCEVVLAQQAVSRTHARISRDGTLFFVEDLGSSFGTQINGKSLPQGEKRLLRNGDVIAIAQFDVTFDRVEDEDSEDPGRTSFLSRKVVKNVMKGLSSGQNAYFRVMNGSAEGQRIEIADAQEYVFGRDAEEVDVVLNDDLVSRKHVKVRRDWSGTQVEDLGSRNGIKLNKQRTRSATIKDRDELEIGGVRLLFIDPNEVREEPIIMPSSAEEVEGTVSVKGEEEAEQPEEPEQPQASSQDESPSEPEPEPSAAADEELVQSGDQPESSHDESPDLEPVDEPQQEPGPRKLIDVSNKLHLFALGIGAAMVIVGVVLIILLAAGA